MANTIPPSFPETGNPVGLSVVLSGRFQKQETHSHYLLVFNDSSPVADSQNRRWGRIPVKVSNNATVWKYEEEEARDSEYRRLQEIRNEKIKG